VALSHLFHGFIFIAFFRSVCWQDRDRCPAIFLVRVRGFSWIAYALLSLSRLEPAKAGRPAAVLWLFAVQDFMVAASARLSPFASAIALCTHPLITGDLLCSDGTQRQIVPSNDKPCSKSKGSLSCCRIAP